MADRVHNKLSGLLPLDLAQLSITELCQAYDAALAADLGLQSILSRPNTDIDSDAGDWMDKQAQQFTLFCQHIKDELLERSEPEDDVEAAMRRECIVGYALRCGASTHDLIGLLVAASEQEQKAA